MKASIQHVSVPRPPGMGSADRARAFYRDLLGLQELPVPKSIQHLDLVWFQVGDLELHLFAEDPVENLSGRHFCLNVEDQAAIRVKLVEAGFEPEDTIAIPGRPRFFCRDPFNNMIEFTTIEADYLTLQDGN